MNVAQQNVREFVFDVTDRGRCPDPTRRAIAELLQRFPEKKMVITVRKHVKRRSKKQNDYVWAMVEQHVLPLYRESDPHCDAEDVYDDIVQQIGYRVEYTTPDGRKAWKRQRTREFSTEQYSEFMEKFWHHCAEVLGVYIPSPREYFQENY